VPKTLRYSTLIIIVPMPPLPSIPVDLTEQRS
jgi:hypothetical protein